MYVDDEVERSEYCLNKRCRYGVCWVGYIQSYIFGYVC